MLVRVGSLPDSALAAAAEFFDRVLPQLPPLPFWGGDGGGGCQASAEPTDTPHPNPVSGKQSPGLFRSCRGHDRPETPEGEGLLLVFEPADHTHRAWRLAAVQALAREHTPQRINAVASDDETAVAAAHEYLANAPGVTGQYWPLDAQGANCA
ncbi:MAG: Rossmann fold domain-containing protein [Novosphingobium sp.]